ncbi:hypothetical protein B0H67DRAFT_650805 [Lasiosphaeris hirsuta]|uniref:Uncharacterized protein n=1 Tax=Lasiosphaeris hirsuta TaxID=260670 RepID=A0AA40B8H2_9PEZI|nr:hypothetical protein B0H67DRAFT_650805 [Lasiosphaeris hirsuta]
MAPEEAQKAKAYRLRGIPLHLDRQGVADLVCGSLPNLSRSDITIASLALSCGFWSSNSRTATLTFATPPTVVRGSPAANGWRLPAPGLREPLILDDDFSGLTPLNDVPVDQHEHDCIVISGLASHPMGSWQPRGQDKSFMWIRDALPNMVDGTRFILYGYDTALIRSKSFQSVEDIAISLREIPYFFAHSLGGIVLKQTFVMLTGSGAAEVSMLAKTIGAIFFGVPSEGMQVSDIKEILGKQPNKDALVKDISAESSFLPQLERQVAGISYVRKMRLFWYYETQTTPAVEVINRQYQRSGEEVVLVSKQSATGGRCNWDPVSTIQIDTNHSEMVKLSPGHHLIAIIAYKLRGMPRYEPLAAMEERWIQGIDPTRLTSLLPQVQPATKMISGFSDPWLDPEFWDRSIQSPKRDHRLAQIDAWAGFSFEWIRGRLASGKSTMIKFLYGDRRTWQLVKGWQDENDMLTPLLPMFQNRYQEQLQSHNLGSLRVDLVRLIDSCGLKLDSRAHAAIATIWECQFDRRKLREIIQRSIRSVPGVDSIWHLVERSVLARKELILNLPPTQQGEPGKPPPPPPLTPEGQLRSISPPIYCTEWDDITITLFLSAVLKWSKAIDLRDKLVSLVALTYPNAQGDMRRRSVTMIDDIWSKAKLDQALELVLNQKLVHLDIFLFLDALDEYDGPPEFIADFLKGLVKEKPGSQTRIRVLFSSRPWNPDVPGTKEIIRLIGYIVQRARGVFLWVKLVMHDLCRHAAGCVAADMDSRGLRKELLRTLKALPENLVDYYSAIIERISPSSRWETYCLLECVCRSYDATSLDQVPAMLACSAVSGYEQLLEISQGLGDMSKGGAEGRLRDVSGGLIEVVNTHVGQTTLRQLQLLHQTVLEFVEQPEFKRVVLGQLAHIMVENGHTFLTKYLLCGREFQVNPTILRHAYQSEKTTGVGVYDLLRDGNFTIPGYLLERGIQSDVTQRLPRLKVSPIGVAVSGMLHLSIQEALDQNDAIIAKSSESESFLSLVMWSFDKSLCKVQEAVAMVEFLIAHGCKLDRDVSGLSKLITRDRNDDSSFERPFEADESDQLIKAALAGCTNLEVDLLCFPYGDLGGKPLHFSLPATAEYLLGRGANPNSLTPHGETPLDVVVQALHSSRYLTLEERRDMCLLLTQAGGSLRRCGRADWEILMAKFKSARLDPLPFPGGERRCA